MATPSMNRLKGMATHDASEQVLNDQSYLRGGCHWHVPTELVLPVAVSMNLWFEGKDFDGYRTPAATGRIINSTEQSTTPAKVQRACVHSAIRENLEQQPCLGFMAGSVTYTNKVTTMTGQSTSTTDRTFTKQQTSDQSSHSKSISFGRHELQSPSSQSQSPVNIHKALPPVPPLEISLSRLPQSATTTSSSFARFQDTNHRPSTASSVSSARSRSSSKTEFRIITRGLVNPDMAGRNITLSPVEPDMYLNPTKYDPGNPLKSPRTPLSFTSIRDANPYTKEPQSPMYMPPPLSLRRMRDPAKTDYGRAMPQSHSEPTLHGLDGQKDAKETKYHIPVHIGERSLAQSPSNTSNGAGCGSRGRTVHRPTSPSKMLQDVSEGMVLDVQTTPRKRSRSPVKRLLGLGKSTSLKDIASEPQTHGKEGQPDKSKRTGLQVWSDKFRHGFLSSDPKIQATSSPGEGIATTARRRQSTPPISLDPPSQAKVYSEMELMICVTANNYLVRELAAGRMSAESVDKVSTYWSSKNRPQVIEFQYDQATQRDLILYNLTTLKFHGESAESPLVLNATMYSWKTMAKEMSVRTFCAPDSQVRKHMHDAHKIMEMLGAPLVTFLAFQELQLRTLAKITEGVKKMEEKRREDRRKEIEAGAETGTHSRNNSNEANHALHSGKTSRDEHPSQHSRNVSRETSDVKQHLRKISRDGQGGKEVTEDIFSENSRGGRLGLMIRGGR